MKNLIEAWFDGCCEPKNPGGYAAAGVLVKVNGVTVWQKGKFIISGPEASNNVAEYYGCAMVLKYITKEELKGDIIIRGDSQLVIKQLLGEWKVKGGLYLKYWQRTKELLEPIKDRVKFEWIKREENDVCDGLSKQVLKEMNVQFKIQPE